MIATSSDLWIELAIDDLESSRFLYDGNKFRNSYFLYQQSVEKANKAFGLKSGLLTVEDLEKDKHDQFKMYRRYAVRQRERFSKLITRGKNSEKNIKNINAFSEIISFIDSLRNLDLFKLDEEDLTRLPEVFDQMKFSDGLRKVIEDMDINLNNEVMHVFKEGMFWMESMIFILSRLIICAFLTIQHSTKTRYPVADHNPILIYTIDLPLIKHQKFFMDILMDALVKLKTFKNFDI